ncbi:MAG: phage recombination protein Bet [Mesorhizobium sp.]
MNALAQIQPSRLPIAPSIAKEFDIQPAEWRVLVDQIFPAAKSVEAVMMALAYCRKRNLDIFKKPVHIVPMWSTAKGQMVETVWPGIAEIRTTASRTGEYAGIDAVEFGPMVERSFTGTVGKGQREETITKKVRFPEWASVVVYRIVAGVRCAYHAKVFWEETFATIGKSEVPNDMWAKRPRGQLDKCVEAAALRKAFPEELGNTYAAEEMEGRSIDGATIEHIASPQPPAPPKPPAPPSGKIVDAEVVDETTGEVIDHREIVAETGEDAGAVMDSGSFDYGRWFEEFQAAMDQAATAEDVAEVWNNCDPLATFEGDDDSQALAQKIKRETMLRIGGQR